MKTKIYSKIFKNGLQVENLQNLNFKNEANDYFRNNKNFKSFKKNFEVFEDLRLTFDDRLNVFFLFKEYQPVVGFYAYQNTVQIFPFYSKYLEQAMAMLISYQDFLKKRTITANDQENQ